VAPYRVLVVDDERPARAKVARLLEGDRRFVLAGEASDGLEALERVEALSPDLIVLDVQMPGIDGFEVLDALGAERDPAIVFSTAHDEYALRAFDANAVDYLLKPYDVDRFRRALDKARAQLAAGRAGGEPVAGLLAAADPGGSRRLVLKTAAGWVPLPLASVLRASAAGKYVEVHSTEGRHLARQSLRALAARLDPARFVRVHRGEIVNVGAVARLEPWAHGDGLLTLSDGSAVVLSRTYRRAFLERFRPP
jgi:two-component system LytT family response regulator